MFSQLPRSIEEIQALLQGARLYTDSVQHAGGEILCFAKDAHQHYLLAIFNPQLPSFLRDNFGGETQDISDTLALKWCLPDHSNAKKLRALFPWTAPQMLSTVSAFPIRDLIGLAAPAILQAHAAYDYNFALTFEAAPDELATLSRTMDEALDAVTFAVFRENYRRPWAMRAAELDNIEAEEKYQRLGYNEFAFAGDFTDFQTGESQAWQRAALAVVEQKAPNLHAELLAGGLSFPQLWAAKTESGAWRWRDRVYRLLLESEELYSQAVRESAEPLFTAFHNNPLRNQ